MEQLDAYLASADVAITPDIEAVFNAVHQVHQNPTPLLIAGR